MILYFDDSDEFLKFVKECSEHRYRLYFNLKDRSYILRPSKTSKGLDTAIFTGNLTDEVKSFVEKKYLLVTVDEMLLTKD